jgi:hypothetical protein
MLCSKRRRLVRRPQAAGAVQGTREARQKRDRSLPQKTRNAAVQGVREACQKLDRSLLSTQKRIAFTCIYFKNSSTYFNVERKGKMRFCIEIDDNQKHKHTETPQNCVEDFPSYFPFLPLRESRGQAQVPGDLASTGNARVAGNATEKRRDRKNIERVHL